MSVSSRLSRLSSGCLTPFPAQHNWAYGAFFLTCAVKLLGLVIGCRLNSVSLISIQNGSFAVRYQVEPKSKRCHLDFVFLHAFYFFFTFSCLLLSLKFIRSITHSLFFKNTNREQKMKLYFAFFQLFEKSSLCFCLMIERYLWETVLWLGC